MDKGYDVYLAFLEKYRDELETYLSFEKEKRQALLNNSLERLEAMLKVQQAETMKLKGFEAKRLKLQEELGLPNVRAKELLPLIQDAGMRGKMEKVLAQISDLAQQISEHNKKALELAEMNLKISQLVTGEAEVRFRSYGPDSGQRQTHSGGGAFEEKV